MTELALTNRITLLQSRMRNNSKIVRKLERKLKKIKEQQNESKK